MSVAQPRAERLADAGDVLTEIRRLVARGGTVSGEGGSMVVTARVLSDSGDERAASSPRSLALSVELPVAGMGQSGAGPSPADGSRPGQVTATQDHGAASTPQDAPFRLGPDAMIPAPAPAVMRKRLRPRSDHDRSPVPLDTENLSVSGATAGTAASERPASRSPWVAGDGTNAVTLPSGQPQSPVPRADNPAGLPEAASQGTTPPAALPEALMITVAPDGAAQETASLSRESDMQAYANSPVTPMHADQPMHLVSDRPASAADALPEDDENPLRALLREVVQEEFEGELQQRLDDNLRRMVRAEIAAALTEALMRRPRG